MCSSLGWVLEDHGFLDYIRPFGLVFSADCSTRIKCSKLNKKTRILCSKRWQNRHYHGSTTFMGSVFSANYSTRLIYSRLNKRARILCSERRQNCHYRGSTALIGLVFNPDCLTSLIYSRLNTKIRILHNVIATTVSFHLLIRKGTKKVVC